MLLLLLGQPMRFGQLKRREFITLLGGAAAAWPLAAGAQQNVRHVGVLMSLPENSQEGQGWITAFRDGLQKGGWSESRNIRIDVRWGATDAALQDLPGKSLPINPTSFWRKTHRPRWPCCS